MLSEIGNLYGKGSGMNLETVNHAHTSVWSCQSLDEARKLMRLLGDESENADNRVFGRLRLKLEMRLVRPLFLTWFRLDEGQEAPRAAGEADQVALEKAANHPRADELWMRAMAGPPAVRGEASPSEVMSALAVAGSREEVDWIVRRTGIKVREGRLSAEVRRSWRIAALIEAHWEFLRALHRKGDLGGHVDDFGVALEKVRREHTFQSKLKTRPTTSAERDRTERPLVASAAA